MDKTLYYDTLMTQNHTYILITSEKGLIFVGSQDRTIAEFTQLTAHQLMEYDLRSDAKRLNVYKQALAAYFNGEVKTFQVPLDQGLFGTVFQQQVWQAIQTIPYGKTADYSEIANQIGRPQATRAVASAVGKNPLMVIVPCHRVLRKDGKLGGYRGGLTMKKELLALEQGEANIAL